LPRRKSSCNVARKVPPPPQKKKKKKKPSLLRNGKGAWAIKLGRKKRTLTCSSPTNGPRGRRGPLLAFKHGGPLSEPRFSHEDTLNRRGGKGRKNPRVSCSLTKGGRTAVGCKGSAFRAVCACSKTALIPNWGGKGQKELLGTDSKGAGKQSLGHNFLI